MSAKNTPLFENGSSKATRIGEKMLDTQSVGVYVEPFDLPEHEPKRSVCEDHIITGIHDEMMNEFWVEGCAYDIPLEERVVRVGFSCIGQSALRKKCRMKLTQYDAEGNVLNTGTLR